MVLEIVKYGNPVLRAKGAEINAVDEKVQKLADWQRHQRLVRATFRYEQAA